MITFALLNQLRHITNLYTSHLPLLRIPIRGGGGAKQRTNVPLLCKRLAGQQTTQPRVQNRCVQAPLARIVTVSIHVKAFLASVRSHAAHGSEAVAPWGVRLVTKAETPSHADITVGVPPVK